MEKLQTLNFAGIATPNKEMVNIKDLTVYLDYPISQFVAVNTKLGRKIILSFDDGTSIWLPDRFKNLTDDFIQSINEGDEKYVMEYKGMKRLSGSREMHHIVFKIQ
jgi:hypothetical protein